MNHGCQMTTDRAGCSVTARGSRGNSEWWLLQIWEAWWTGWNIKSTRQEGVKRIKGEELFATSVFLSFLSYEVELVRPGMR